MYFVDTEGENVPMQLVAVDWETYYDRKQGYSLRSKGMTTESYIRDPRFEAIMVCIAPFIDGQFRPRVFTGEHIAKGLATIDWAKTAMVAWNAHFDGAILTWRYGHRIKAPLCSMSMFRMMGLPQQVGGESLDVATKWAIENGYSDRIVPKGNEVIMAEGKRLADFSATELEAYAKYCREDTVNAGHMFNIMIERGFAPSELPPMAEIIRCYTEPTLRVNVPIMAQCHAEQVKAQQTALARGGVDDVTSLRSDVKFAQVLRANGCEPGTKISKRTGKPQYAFAKGDDFMHELLNGDDEVLANLAEARIANKSSIIATRSQRFMEIGQRGPFPVMLKPGGAHTMRLAGGDNSNPQNMNKKGLMRKGIEAGPGYKLIGCDKSQIELRMNAYVSGQTSLVEAFREKRDAYSEYGNEAGVFGVEVSKKTVDERFICKGVVLGSGFGASGRAVRSQVVQQARALQLNVNLDAFDFNTGVKAWRRLNKQIVDNWYRTGEQLEAMIAGQETQRGTDGLVHFVPGKGFRFPNGMYIYYHDLHWEDGKESVDPDTGEIIPARRELWFMGAKYGKRVRKYIYHSKAVENYIQGLAGLNLREDWAEITRRQKKEIGLKWGAVKLQVHDELIARVKTEAASDYMALMQEVMTTPPWWAPGLPLDCEPAIGDNYLEIS